MNCKKYLESFFKKRHRVEITSIIALLILASIFNMFANQLKQERGQEKLATLAVNFETEKRFFEGEVYDGMTILDALNAAVSVGKIKLNYFLNDKNQTQIMELDGYVNGIEDKYFSFYLNDKRIDSQNLNKVYLKAGDKIEILFQ